jgi:cytochrome c oxidase subunit 2
LSVAGASLLTALAVFGVGVRGLAGLTVPPIDGMTVEVHAFRWGYSASYHETSRREPLPARVTLKDSAFKLPVGVPVHLHLTSDDVVHGLSIPNLRIKAAAIPGQVAHLWIEPLPGPDEAFPEASAPGARAAAGTVVPFFCSQECGEGHSSMVGTVEILPRAGFDAWLRSEAERSAGGPTVARGKKTYDTVCIACHTLDGSPRVGPSFLGLFGRTTTTADGRQIPVDDEYIRRSILEPQKDVAKGFENVVMPPQVLSEEDIASVILFLKTVH